MLDGTMPVFTYNERQGDLSPTSANFTNTSQSCSVLYNFHAPTFDQLRSSIIDLLGYTVTAVNSASSDCRIRRILPARHPAYQWMFADSCSPQGIGSTFTNITPSPGNGSPIIPNFPLYADYELRVSFSPRPYSSWQDADIAILKNQTAYKKDGSSYTYTAACEWNRFTTFDLYPVNNFISAQQGQAKFRTSDGVGGTPTPNNNQFQDAPRMYLPDSMLKVKWWQVPYRFLTSTNSYLRKFVGHINQTAFKPEYPAGSLLFLGANPTQIYMPPIPDPGILAFSKDPDALPVGRLCDLELNFLYTARTLDPSQSAPTYANKNWIVAGHNLQPWLTTRMFYYTSSEGQPDAADQTKWYPNYFSFPHELLFTDPDSPGSPRLDP